MPLQFTAIALFMRQALPTIFRHHSMMAKARVGFVCLCASCWCRLLACGWMHACRTQLDVLTAGCDPKLQPLAALLMLLWPVVLVGL